MSLFQRLIRLIGYGRWPIRYKMLGVVVAAAVLPLLAFLIVQTVVRYQNLSETTGVVLEQQAQVATLLVEGRLEHLLTTIKEAGNEPRIRAYGITLALANSRSGGGAIEANLVREAMEETIEQHPEIRAIRLLDPQGKLLVVSGPVAELQSIAMSQQREHPAFVQVAGRELSGEDVFLLEPYLDPGSQLPMFEAVSPLVESNTLYGYLVFSLEQDMVLAQPLAEALAASRDLTVENGVLYVLDASGRLLSPMGDRPLLTTEMPLERMEPEEAEESPRPGVYLRDWGASPAEVMGRYRVVDLTGWHVVSEVPTASVMVAVLRELSAGTQPALIVVVILSLLLAFWTNRLVAVPIVRLQQASEQLAAGNLDAPLPEMTRADELGALTQTFGSMAEQVRSSIQDLEHRVADRIRDLELATTIGRESASFQELDALLNYAIDRIVESFPKIYHAQIFLLDDSRENAILAASTGEAGRELLRRGHFLAVGSVSVIGRVTELGETVIARDTSTSRVHRRNEFLPDTRAEMALPLVHGNQVLGALDMQSKLPNAFNPDEQALFEALAAQLAIAIDNNRRLEASQQRMSELEAQNRLLTQHAWREVLGGKRRGVLDARAGAVADPARGSEWSIWQHRAALQREVVVSPPDADGFAALAVPILSRGEVLGVVEWQMPADRINPNTQLLAHGLVERLTTTLETFRLLERTERQAERERLVNEISGRLTSEPNIPLILQAAVQQLSDVLGTSQVRIQLKQSDAAPANGRPDADRMESM